MRAAPISPCRPCQPFARPQGIRSLVAIAALSPFSPVPPVSRKPKEPKVTKRGQGNSDAGWHVLARPERDVGSKGNMGAAKQGKQAVGSFALPSGVALSP
jgi:hypothetical protein